MNMKDMVELFGGNYLFDGALIQFTDTTFMAALKKIYESGALEERERFVEVLRQLHDSYSLASDSNAIRAKGDKHD